MSLQHEKETKQVPAADALHRADFGKTDLESDADANFVAPAKKRQGTSWLVVGACGVFSLGLTLGSFWLAAWVQHLPHNIDVFGVLLALTAGLEGWVLAALDRRPKKIRDKKRSDAAAKKMASEVKRDADFFSILAAVFGLPAVLSKVFSGTLSNGVVLNNIGAICATISAMVVFYNVILKYRTSKAELSRLPESEE